MILKRTWIGGQEKDVDRRGTQRETDTQRDIQRERGYTETRRERDTQKESKAKRVRKRETWRRYGERESEASVS